MESIKRKHTWAVQIMYQLLIDNSTYHEDASTSEDHVRELVIQSPEKEEETLTPYDDVQEQISNIETPPTDSKVFIWFKR